MFSKKPSQKYSPSHIDSHEGHTLVQAKLACLFAGVNFRDIITNHLVNNYAPCMHRLLTSLCAVTPITAPEVDAISDICYHKNVVSWSIKLVSLKISIQRNEQ